MAVAGAKAARRKSSDMDGLLSEVASFASSLGLTPAAGSAAGFDDSDFRKTGSMRPPEAKSDGEEKAARPPKNNPLEKANPFGNEATEKAAKGKLPLMKAVTPMGLWYDESSALEAKLNLTVNSCLAKSSGMVISDVKRIAERKTEVAQRLMMQYAEDYEVRTRKHGDWQLVRTAAKSGTTNDKVTALATLVGDNPVANLKSLDILLGLVTAKVGKRYAFKGFDHLTELFKTRLLPDRKLKCLVQRQISSLPESSDGYSLLLFWYWEECLKQRYEKFVTALEEASKDMLPSLKDIATKLLYGLLRSKMEQERKLLYALVNKLGDPVRKAASSAGYYLTRLLSEHPNMKLVVIEEVDAFIFRPHVGLRAKYHAINFLSQILLSKKGDGPKVAKRLVDIYFALFKVLISSRLENTKDGSATNRSLMKRGNQKKKFGSKSIKMTDNSMESCVEMDSRLLCALLTGVNRAFPYVASDEADDVIEVQTPILFKLVHSNNFNIGVQALTLLYQISFKNQILSDRFYRALYSKLLQPSALNSSKHEIFLALLFKAMKGDLNVKRISAFSKRLLQISLQQPPQYACGCLCLISEVLKVKSHLWTMMLQTESADEDLEHFTDIKDDTIEVTDNGPIKSQGTDETRVAKSYDFKSEKSDVELGISYNNASEDGKVPVISYNPQHRDPAYCNAETAGWWELSLLAAHVHPSVAAMAQTLLSGVNIVYNGDPLADLSLPSFLDKFMEKKPKASQRGEETWHGGSQIAPARKPDLNSRLIGEDILQLAEDEVPPEDIIFHKFYANKSTSSKKKKKKPADDEDEDLVPMENNDGGEDEEEEMLGLPLAIDDVDGGYDYDDLDEVAAVDDDDLLDDDDGVGMSDDEDDGDDDVDEELPRKHKRKKYRDGGDDGGDDGDEEPPLNDDDDDVDLEDEDNVDEGLPVKHNKKKYPDDDDDDDDFGMWDDEDDPQEHKRMKKSRVSPFVSAEDFEREKEKYLEGRGRKSRLKPRQDREKKKKRDNPSD